MLDRENQQQVVNTVEHWMYQAYGAICEFSKENMRPSVLFKPKLSIDGSQWCALYGDDLQDGIAGFGPSPELAMWDFDSAWRNKLIAKVAAKEAL